MFENIKLALRGIFTHKMRSFLTMLGIIIGIASIIAIVSTIKGTNEQIKNNLVGAGTNTVNVSLYSGGYEVEFSYRAVPDGISPVSDETIAQIEELDDVVSVARYVKRAYADG
ncbi:MAG: ABC transporter permease, partial [Oscillospiraceae bacterium]|nr:ABC transporter permease [Oscillospiraceae bacterium]